MSENPWLLVRDVDASLRAAEREVSKLRNQALQALGAAKRPNPAMTVRVTAHMLQRLDHLIAVLEVPSLTRWRMEQASCEPMPEPPGCPDDLRCKLCGEEKGPHDFFFDDGHGRYGYTGRCARCRRLPKRERRRIADRRGLRQQSERNRAIGKAVGR